MHILDISTLFHSTGTAKLADLSVYETAAKAAISPGADATLTGPRPVWLYLRLAHALHGHWRSLTYDSPVTETVLVFNRDPT